MSNGPTPYESYDDPERVLRRFVIRRAGEMGRMAAWLGRLLDLPRRAADAVAARLDATRREEVLAATARALAWANALRRWMTAINRVQKEEYLPPVFAPAPAGSLLADKRDGTDRDGPGRDGPRREPALRMPAADFVPMDDAEMREALKQPFLPAAVMARMVNSVQARAVTLTREVDEHLRRARAADAAYGRQPTPEEDAAALGVEELPFGTSLARICADLIAAATALGEADIVAAVHVVAADLERRCAEMMAMQAARAQAARAHAAQAQAERAQAARVQAERAAVAPPVAVAVATPLAVPSPPTFLPRKPLPATGLPATPLAAALLPAFIAVDLPSGLKRPGRGSLRAQLYGSVMTRAPVLESA